MCGRCLAEARFLVDPPRSKRHKQAVTGGPAPPDAVSVSLPRPVKLCSVKDLHRTLAESLLESRQTVLWNIYWYRNNVAALELFNVNTLRIRQRTVDCLEADAATSVAVVSLTVPNWLHAQGNTFSLQYWRLICREEEEEKEEETEQEEKGKYREKKSKVVPVTVV